MPSSPFTRSSETPGATAGMGLELRHANLLSQLHPKESPAQANPNFFRKPANRIPCFRMKNYGLHTLRVSNLRHSTRLRPGPAPRRSKVVGPHLGLPFNATVFRPHRRSTAGSAVATTARK